jgi:hypothetical protein
MIGAMDSFDTEKQKQEVMEVWQRARAVYAALAAERQPTSAGRDEPLKRTR